MQWFTRKKFVIILVSLVSLVLLYTIIGFLAAPWYAKRYLADFVSDDLQRELHVAEFKFNPYTFVAEISDVSLRENNADPIVSLDSVVVNIDLDRITDKTLTVKKLTLDDPRLDLIIDVEGELNLQKLLQNFPESQQDDKNDAGFNIVFESSEIAGGQVLVTDKSRDKPITSAIRDINLQLSGISTLEKEEGQYRINLDLEQATELQLQGTLTLIPLASTGRFTMQQISAETLSKWLGEYLPMKQIAGTGNIKGVYTLTSDSAGKMQIRVNKGKVQLNNLSASDKYSGMSASVRNVLLTDFGYQNNPHRITAPAISIDDLNIDTESGGLGSLSALKLSGFEFNAGSGQLMLDSALLEQARLVPRENHAPLLNLESLVVDTVEYVPGDQRLNIGSINLDNNTVLLETDTNGQIVLPQLPARELPVEHDDDTGNTGSANLAFNLGELSINNHQLKYLATDAETVDLARFDNLAITGTTLEPGQSKSMINDLTASGGELNISRDDEGVIDIIRLFAAGETNSDNSNESVSGESLPELLISAAELKNINVHLTDDLPGTPVQYSLTDLTVSADNISTAPEARIDLTVGGILNDTGFLSLEGWIEPARPATEMHFAVDDFDLTRIDTYLRPATKVSLQNGSISLVGTFNYQPQNSGISITDAGAGLLNLQLTQVDSGEKLISVDTIDINGLSLGLDPASIVAEQVSMKGPYANFFIDEQQNLNLLQAFNTGNDTTGLETGNTTQDNHDLTLSVQRIDLEAGSMDFADLSLVPEFSTRIHELKGTASGLSSDPERYTSLELDGRVEEFGAAKITGELQPFDYREQSKINMQFSNINTESLSPYAARFAGRKIKSGSLWLGLDYTIANSKLGGNNDIVLESLTLGDKVESPDAMDLPLDMAISLLQDDEGRIDINLPISGDLDNPQFDLDAVIQKAVGNLVGGIVTAPFRFLGSLFGVSGEELQAVGFEPGSATITPPESENLATLNQVLRERPALKLIVRGVYDEKLDSKALARQTIIDHITQQSGQEAAPLNYSNPGTRDILDQLAAERLESATLEKIRTQTGAKSTEGEDTAGADAAESGPRRYYEAVFKQLVDHVEIKQTTLETLAKDRARAIIDGLTEKDNAIADRVTIIDEIKSVESDNLVNVTLEADTIH